MEFCMSLLKDIEEVYDTNLRTFKVQFARKFKDIQGIMIWEEFVLFSERSKRKKKNERRTR